MSSSATTPPSTLRCSRCTYLQVPTSSSSYGQTSRGHEKTVRQALPSGRYGYYHHHFGIFAKCYQGIFALDVRHLRLLPTRSPTSTSSTTRRPSTSEGDTSIFGSPSRKMAEHGNFPSVMETSYEVPHHMGLQPQDGDKKVEGLSLQPRRRAQTSSTT